MSGYQCRQRFRNFTPARCRCGGQECGLVWQAQRGGHASLGHNSFAFIGERTHAFASPPSPFRPSNRRRSLHSCRRQTPRPVKHRRTPPGCLSRRWWTPQPGRATCPSPTRCLPDRAPSRSQTHRPRTTENCPPSFENTASIWQVPDFACAYTTLLARSCAMRSASSPISPSTSFVCWPSAGGAWRSTGG